MPEGNTVSRPATGQLSAPAPEAQLKSVLVANADYKEGGGIRNSLEASGYDVSCWTRPEDAVERFRIRPFEVVCFATNIGDKGIDQLLEVLRPQKVPPKVILIADEDEGDAAARCFLRTVIVVNRPFKVGEIADIVEHLIGPA
jgi:DNA-binding response OmpR family regulator